MEEKRPESSPQPKEKAVLTIEKKKRKGKKKTIVFSSPGEGGGSVHKNGKNSCPSRIPQKKKSCPS